MRDFPWLNDVEKIDASAFFPVELREPPPFCPAAWRKRKRGWRGYYLKTAIWHKFFKRWDQVLYLDAGMHIRGQIDEMFSIRETCGHVLAIRDSTSKRVFQSKLTACGVGRVWEAMRKEFPRMSVSTD